jgi:hypothetical protein
VARPFFNSLLGAVLTGAARPAPQFNNSSFWAQGANIGLRYDF